MTAQDYRPGLVCAVSAAAVGTDERLPPAERSRGAERRAAYAVQLLGPARLAGYFRCRALLREAEGTYPAPLPPGILAMVAGSPAGAFRPPVAVASSSRSRR
jgi:hypothetical protein